MAGTEVAREFKPLLDRVSKTPDSPADASWVHQSNLPVDIPCYLRVYAASKRKLDELITHRFRLVKINAALDAVRGPETGRCLFRMSASLAGR